MSDLIQWMESLDEAQVLSVVRRMHGEGVSGMEILRELQEGMRRVGNAFEAGKYFLPELIMSGVIFEQAMDTIKESLTRSSSTPEYGTFLIGTVKDDIHDIGKNIVASLLGCQGFHVVDLGVDVPVDTFLQGIREHKPTVVGLSCLLTTSFDSMKDTIDTIKKTGLKTGLPVIVGGATIDRSVCDYVGADAFCPNANSAVQTAQKMAGGA